MGRIRVAVHPGVRRIVRILFMINGSQVRLEFQTRQDEPSQKHDETDWMTSGCPEGSARLSGRSGEIAVHSTLTESGNTGRMAS